MGKFKKLYDSSGRTENIIKKFKSLRITGRMEKQKRNTHYRLSDGNIITIQFAVDMCKLGYLENYEIYPIDGEEYLRGKPDNDINNNIVEQPLFTFEVTDCQSRDNTKQ